METYEQAIRGQLVKLSRHAEGIVAELAPRVPHQRAQHEMAGRASSGYRPGTTFGTQKETPARQKGLSFKYEKLLLIADL